MKKTIAKTNPTKNTKNDEKIKTTQNTEQETADSFHEKNRTEKKRVPQICKYIMHD